MGKNQKSTIYVLRWYRLTRISRSKLEHKEKKVWVYVDIASRVFQGQSLGIRRYKFEYIGEKFIFIVKLYNKLYKLNNFVIQITS
jgi:hypothetical protein